MTQQHLLSLFCFLTLQSVPDSRYIYKTIYIKAGFLSVNLCNSSKHCPCSHEVSIVLMLNICVCGSEKRLTLPLLLQLLWEVNAAIALDFSKVLNGSGNINLFVLQKTYWK